MNIKMKPPAQIEKSDMEMSVKSIIMKMCESSNGAAVMALESDRRLSIADESKEAFAKFIPDSSYYLVDIPRLDRT
jgi:hypothetical protein